MARPTPNVTAAATAVTASCRSAEAIIDRSVKVANTAPTASAASPLRTTERTTANVPEVRSQGSSGMKAPMAKVTKEAAAACQGEPRLWSVMPISSRAWVSSARSGSCITSLAMSCATLGSIPRRTYMLRGIEPSVAQDMANEVMQDPDLALETHAREEMGITDQSLGSPWQAAAASFVTFAIGAFIPLLPWLLTSGTLAVVLSVVLSGLAALAVGAVLATFTERPMVSSALRQLAVTTVAAAVTFGVGRAIGAGTGVS